MSDFNAGNNYAKDVTELRKNVHESLLRLLDNTKGILSQHTEDFAKTTVKFLQDLGLDEAELTELKLKLTTVQDKERLIWEIRIPQAVHFCSDCTTEDYRECGCYKCEYSGIAGAYRYFCKLGHTTIVIVRDTTGNNKNVLIGDHFRTEHWRPTN